jgi:PAS domain S-box-containing protein
MGRHRGTGRPTACQDGWNMHYRALVESLPCGVLRADADRRVTFSNSTWNRMFDVGDGEVVGLDCVDVFGAGADAGEIRRQISDAAAGATPAPAWTGTCHTRARRAFEAHVTWTCERTSGQGVEGFTATIFDMTALMQAANVAGATEVRFRELAESLPDVVFESALDGSLTYLNRAASDLWGYRAEDFPAGTSIVTALYEDDRQRAADNLMGLLHGDRVATESEYLLPTKDGRRVVPVLIRANVIVRNGRPVGFRGIITDISDRKLASAAVRESQLWFNKAFHSSPAPTVIVTPDEGLCIDINDGLLQLMGYSRDEVVGTSIVGLNVWADADARKRYVTMARKAKSVRDFETTFRTKSGEIRRVMLAGEYLSLRGQECLMTVVQDVSEQRQAQAQMLQSQKLEAIGQLAAGIAHEINTPIQFIGDNLRFLQDSFASVNGVLAQHERLLAAHEAGPVPPALLDEMGTAFRAIDPTFIATEIPSALSESLDGVGRVARLVRAMKDFGHPDSTEKADADLNAAIESTVTVARHEWKYVADVRLDLDPGLPRVPCLLGEFNQVVLNLLVNAAHAIADASPGSAAAKGTITISTRCFDQAVEIRVADTGTGVPEAIRSRIFDPFFTTKPVGKGTGQGLAIARAVIEKKHLGSLAFESETGKGTTFIIRLPLAPHP